SWLKHFHPDAFCCGLLNSQPMGFYAPAQIVGDARKNGVTVREIDVSFSYAQNTLEEKDGKYCSVRLGFRQIDGFKWTDPDDERLKQIQASFRDAASAPSFPGALRMPRNDDAGEMPILRNDNEIQFDDWVGRIVAARNRRPFTSLED